MYRKQGGQDRERWSPPQGDQVRLPRQINKLTKEEHSRNYQSIAQLLQETRDLLDKSVEIAYGSQASKV